ncbi:Retrovirus-related Pol polyprotein, partial [Mucuna pruriens]
MKGSLKLQFLLYQNFQNLFELECDASNVGIGVVILQEGHLIAYFKLYALARALQTWQHYLLSKEFVIHNDHGALKHLRGQGKINVVVDALSRRHALISMLETKMLRLDFIKELYEKKNYFSEPFAMYVHLAFHDFFRHYGFLFKGKRLYVLMSSIWQLLMIEAHEGGLMGHFGEIKTF